MFMKHVLATALLLATSLAAFGVGAAESQSFWDLKPDQLRTLVASPQVMVTRTASGWNSYCRCPLVLKPNEIPEAIRRLLRRSLEKDSRRRLSDMADARLEIDEAQALAGADASP